MKRPKTPLLLALLIFSSLPAAAEASSGSNALRVGDRVLVAGTLHRKCAARVASLPRAGFANLTFDREGCGSTGVAFKTSQLQRITFTDKAHDLAAGDSVVVKGHFGADCAARVKEVSRAGYAALELDSRLCADDTALFKASDLHKVQYVSANENFTVGQKVSAKGIHEGDTCRGEIRALTDNGLARIAFDELTCADAGKLYSTENLKALRPPTARHAKGEAIYQQVMREIASAKKSKKKHARL
jgi:hypothetical protein